MEVQENSLTVTDVAFKAMSQLEIFLIITKRKLFNIQL